jgi:endonuclease YncB( thermonuclease family)
MHQVRNQLRLVELARGMMGPSRNRSKAAPALVPQKIDAYQRRSCPVQGPRQVDKLVIRIVTRLLLLASLVGIAAADPIAPGDIEVIDGDTIRAQARTVRLVGFDAPESGLRAQCESERAIAAKATFRLRQLVSAGGLDLTLIPCSCRRGTEGTPRCNYGRACGVLTAASKDVGLVLISEGLARRYVCGCTSCPPRESWCF